MVIRKTSASFAEKSFAFSLSPSAGDVAPFSAAASGTVLVLNTSGICKPNKIGLRQLQYIEF